MVDETTSKPRVALAHDWLCGYRGGEAVLESIAALTRRHFDAAPLYVMFDDRRPLASHVDQLEHVPSPLNRLPLSHRLRRWLLPAYPLAVAALSRRLARDHARRPIDLLVSTSSAAIKGLRPPEDVPHLCYCHAPARYIWTITDEYAPSRSTMSLALRAVAPWYKRWDRRTAANVTRFLANSTYIAGRIRECFDRPADVVPPPVRTEFFTPDATPRADHWLLVSALEPYKRVDLAILAANKARHPLTIVGDGSQRARLESLAGTTVTFAGRVDDHALRDHYRRARLLLFPQVEDFGIVAVEAQACATPVVARRAGGALDTVIDTRTGTLFDDPTPDAIIDAARRAPHPSEACRRNAERFSADRFEASILAHIHDLLATRPQPA